MKKLFLITLILKNFYLYSQIISQRDLDSINLHPVTEKKIDSFKRILIRNNHLESGWIYYFGNKGLLQFKIKQYDSVIYYERKAIEKYNTLRIKREFDEKKLLKAHLLIGKALAHKKQYNIALNELHKSLELANKYSYKWKSFIIHNIGDCHLELGNLKTALNYYKISLKDSLYNDLDRPSITTNTRIGIIYLEGFNHKDSARYYLIKALKRSKNSSFKENLPSIHSNLGYIFESENKIDSAIYHYSHQKREYDKWKPTYPNAGLFVLINDGYVQIQKGNYKKGLENLNLVYDSIKKIDDYTRDDRDLFVATLNNFILYYTKTNNRIEALKKSEEKVKFLELFYKQLLKERIIDLEIQFQTKEKDKSILHLEQTKLQQETIIKQQKAITYGVGGFLLILSGFGYLFWRQQKLKNLYERVNLEQRLLRSQMNPHFIFNTLSIINSLATKKSEKISTYILKFSSLLRLTLNNSREEFVSLANEISAIKDYLALQSDFNHKFKYTILIDKNIENKDLYIPPMLIQPFIENSIEHGLIKYGNLEEKGRIKIEFTSVINEKLIKCIIVDNGIGYSNSLKNNKNAINSHKSISGNIVKERLEIYKKRFRANSNFSISDLLDDSKKIIGTNVEILIPYVLE